MEETERREGRKRQRGEKEGKRHRSESGGKRQRRTDRGRDRDESRG